MKKIEITEENKEMYQKFYKLKNEVTLSQPTIIFITIACSIFLISSLGINVIFFDNLLVNLISTICLIMAMTFTVEAGYYMEKIIKLKKIKKFQQEYPDFDVNIDIYEVKKKLIEYQQNKMQIYSISELYKSSKVKKTTTSPKENIKKITRDERINYLKKEKEFLIQCKENEIKEEKDIQKTIKF